MRLTKKTNKGIGESVVYVSSYNNIVNLGNNEATSMCHDKLGQHEDIEEELGIDLITLFKAIKDGVYVEGKKKHKYRTVWFDDIDTGITDEDVGLYWFDIDDKRFYFKDYGKTWALTKEELL